MKKIDMHCHTTISDGTSTPENLILEAQRKKIELLCITDHDAVSTPLVPHIEAANIISVPSVEISSQNRHQDGKSLHITYYSRSAKQDVGAIIENTRKSKKTLISLQLEHLQKLGFFIDSTEFYVQLQSLGRQDDGLSKYDIARYVASKPENREKLSNLGCSEGRKTHTAFYTKCLKRKGELYDTYAVEVDDYEPEVEVLGAIARAQGAVLAIAHPNFSFSREGITGFLEVFPSYRDLGVNAIEINTRATKKWVGAILQLQTVFPDIQLTFGSDCHQIGKPDDKHGELGFENAEIDEEKVIKEVKKFTTKMGI